MLYQTSNTSKNKLNGFPTVLFTGGGYHIYQPIEAVVLEDISDFNKFDNPSHKFLKFSEQYLTNHKADPLHSPAFKSCLLRVPGSIYCLWRILCPYLINGKKLSFDANYYNKRTEGLLTETEGSGGSKFYMNSGSMEAKGFEFSLGWKDNISENFTYYFNGNLATTKTKVVSTYKEGFVSYSGPSIFKAGLPAGAFYGYVVEGVYQSYADILASPATTIGDVAPGDLKFKDLNGDGKITSDDRTMIGNPTPDFTYGFSVGADFKGFYFNADFYGVYGNEVFRNWGNGNSYAPFNYREERLDRWTGAGTSNWEPRSNSSTAYNRENSTYMIEDGSFFRIRNVQVGYNFDKALISAMKLEGLKLYFNVQNLKTWDHVNGFTPEFGGSATQFGVNTSGYPNPRVVSFGLSANF